MVAVKKTLGEVKDKKCIFCNAIQHKFFISQSKNAVAFLDIYPTSPGHSLLVSKRHVKNIRQLNTYEIKSLFTLARDVSKTIKSRLEGVKGFNFVINDGKISYQRINHFHLHIIPKYEKSLGYLLKTNSHSHIDIVKCWKLLSKKRKKFGR